MDNIVSRPYTPSDYSACLALFESNLPKFFAQEERAEFCQFLEGVNNSEPPYLVLVSDDMVIACGGLAIEPDKRQARLAWGMVDRAYHRRGLGTLLLQARLEQARAVTNIDELALETSQHSRGFYERFGFKVVKIIPDGFGAGLDRWDMTLRLT